MGIFKEIKKLQETAEKKQKSSKVHPFTIIRREAPERRIYIYILLILTIIVYGGVFYIQFFKKETRQAYKDPIKLDNIPSVVKTNVYKSIKDISIPEGKAGKNLLLYKKAERLYKEGKTEEALYHLKLLLKREDFIPAVILKAKILKNEGLQERAKTILEEAYYKHPEDKNILLALAEIYKEEGAFLLAEEMYKALKEIGDIEGDIGLIQLYREIGKKKKAKMIYKQIINRKDIPSDIKKYIKKRFSDL